MAAWIKLMIRFRWLVIATCLAITGSVMSQIGHLTVIVNSDGMLPLSNHFARIGTEIENTFGNKYTAVVSVTATRGTIYQKPILEKVPRITARLASTPGVIKTSVNALAARKDKSIGGNEEGMIVRPLMESVPQNEAEMEALRSRVASNSAYQDLLVSKPTS